MAAALLASLAGVGVVMALLDKNLRSEAHTPFRRLHYLELASEPDFATAVARATAFPDTERLPQADSFYLGFHFLPIQVGYRHEERSFNRKQSAPHRPFEPVIGRRTGKAS
jgi:hypothetical protein